MQNKVSSPIFKKKCKILASSDAFFKDVSQFVKGPKIIYKWWGNKVAYLSHSCVYYLLYPVKETRVQPSLPCYQKERGLLVTLSVVSGRKLFMESPLLVKMETKVSHTAPTNRGLSGNQVVNKSIYSQLSGSLSSPSSSSTSIMANMIITITIVPKELVSVCYQQVSCRHEMFHVFLVVFFFSPKLAVFVSGIASFPSF